jgi:hypothetical protein
MTDSELLNFDTELTVAVLGRGKEFFLVRMGDNDYAGEIKSIVAAYDYSYCGLIQIKDGEPKVAIEPDPESAFVMAHAGLHLSELIAGCLQRKQLSAQFCERLYSLPDTRG